VPLISRIKLTGRLGNVSPVAESHLGIFVQFLPDAAVRRAAGSALAGSALLVFAFLASACLNSALLDSVLRDYVIRNSA
jgi:hypothetical protein